MSVNIPVFSCCLGYDPVMKHFSHFHRCQIAIQYIDRVNNYSVIWLIIKPGNKIKNTVYIYWCEAV